MTTGIRAFLALAALSVVPLAAQSKPLAVTTPRLSLTLGVYSFKKPTDVYRDFMAAIDDLDRSLTATLGRPVVVNLKVFKTYDECLDRFVAGDVDFVRIGPASYVLVKQRQEKVGLLATEKEDIADGMAGVIAVRANSAIRTLADLKGHSFAFGDESSTIGRYLSQAELVAAGVRCTDLGHFKYLDRHDKVFKAVEIGDFDAGALHFSTFQECNRNSQLRVLTRFKNVGKPWIARAGLQPPVVAALRQSLLGMSDKPALAALKVSGFVAARDKDYDVIRDGMAKSEEFLHPTAPPQPMPGKE